MQSVIEEGFIGVDMPPLPDEIWRGVRLLQLTETVFTADPATTTSATFTAWHYPVTEAVTYSGTAALYGIICANNPVNVTDPDGLSPIKIVTLIGKGFKVIGKVDKMDDAVRLFKEGEDLVASRNTMKEIAKRAGEGRPPIHDVPEKYNPHYHNAARTGGHGFYSSVAGVAAYGSLYNNVEDQNIVARGCAGFLDFFNPLSIPNDVFGLIDLFRSDDKPDDNCK